MWYTLHIVKLKVSCSVAKLTKPLSIIMFLENCDDISFLQNSARCKERIMLFKKECIPPLLTACLVSALPSPVPNLPFNILAFYTPTPLPCMTFHGVGTDIFCRCKNILFITITILPPPLPTAKPLVRTVTSNRYMANKESAIASPRLQQIISKREKWHIYSNNITINFTSKASVESSYGMRCFLVARTNMDPPTRAG